MNECNEKIYQCSCGLIFGKYQNLSAHKSGCKTYLQENGKQIDFICDDCGQVFGNYGALCSHMKFKHEQYKPKEKQRVQCPICNKYIVKNNINRHTQACKKSIYEESFKLKQKYKLDHDDLFCKFCGKECKNKNSLTQHEIRCPQNIYRIISWNKNSFSNCIGEFHCIYCGKIYNYKGACASHEGICNLNPNGKTEFYRRIDSQRITYTKNHELGLHDSSSHQHTEETKKIIGEKVSKTLSDGYASGRLTPNHGIGRGKGSYIYTPDKQVYFCRSTYEFIYALHLHYVQNKKFTLEKVVVPAIRKNQYSKSFRSDFYIEDENLIIEIKGIPSSKDILLKESFEASGYSFMELFTRDINKCKKDLISVGINIKQLLALVIDGANRKEYYQYFL